MAQGDVVWILGAGFSKPLGGPLLADLFAPNSVQTMRDRFKKNLYRSPNVEDTPERLALVAAVWLYNYGICFKNGPVPGFDLDSRPRGERLWDDAEEFLDVLDLAADSLKEKQFPGDDDFKENSLARHLRTFLGNRSVRGANPPDWWEETNKNPTMLLGRVNREARRLMAAQCSAFMLNADEATERWSPFVQWARSLDKKHTVVTFNYDCATEKAAGDKVQVVTDEAVAAPGEKPRLFKVHGSTDWIRVQNTPSCQITRQYGQWACLDHTLEAHICIGTPGINKREVADYLKPIWEGALKAIREAEAVIFVGYRFPPSDSDAREKILGAIQGNNSPHLLLHTVLGPEINDPSTSRLRGLLSSRMADRSRLSRCDPDDGEQTFADDHKRQGMTPPGGKVGRGRRYGIVSHPLYSQDFVSAPGRLFHPHYRADW